MSEVTARLVVVDQRCTVLVGNFTAPPGGKGVGRGRPNVGPLLVAFGGRYPG